MSEHDPIHGVESAAAYVGKPVGTMRHYRALGIGPRSAKLGRNVVYRQSDLDAWVDEQFAVADRARPATSA